MILDRQNVSVNVTCVRAISAYDESRGYKKLALPCNRISQLEFRSLKDLIRGEFAKPTSCSSVVQFSHTNDTVKDPAPDREGRSLLGTLCLGTRSA